VQCLFHYTNQAAIAALFRVMNRYVGNLPPMPGGVSRWGMPPPPRAGGYPVTNIRNTTSPHWRGWLKPENRCLVPANSFAEYAPEPSRSAPRHHEARCCIDGVANSVVPMARADALRRTAFELERWDQQTSRRTR
jgi:hypothetical protein